LADGAQCLTFNSEQGTCRNKTCVASSSGTATSATASTATSATASSGQWLELKQLRIFNLPEAPVYLIITNISTGSSQLWSLVDYCSHHFRLSIFSGGHGRKNVGNGKKTMRASIIGLIVALSGVVVIYAIDSMLRAQMPFLILKNMPKETKYF